MRAFCLFIITCAVIGINCFKLNRNNCNGCGNSGYTRIKRAKYFSNPTNKYYRPHYSSRGPYSHSGYIANEIGPRTSYKPRPYKVSKRPINQALGDEDFTNFIKHLSHKEFDNIFAFEKQLYSNKYKEQTDEYVPSFEDNQNYGILQNLQNEDVSNNYGANDLGVYNYKQINYNNNNYGTYDVNTNYPNTYLQDLAMIDNYINSEIPFNVERSKDIEHLILDEHIQQEVNQVNSDTNNIFTDSSTVHEEQLPKPINLREQDYEVSYTNNVPSVVKPETSYRLENFADLPLMDFENSKLDTVNSYNVPQYSVISSSNQRPSSSRSVQPSAPFLAPNVLSVINTPYVEPAPPASVAREQSDAHLKATKIWTHKSKGTAYTLHDDGTLTLEIPSRPRYKHP